MCMYYENKLTRILEMPTRENKNKVVFVWAGKEVRSIKITIEMTIALELGENDYHMRGDECLGYDWTPFEGYELCKYQISEVIANFQDRHQFERYQTPKRKHSINLMWRNLKKRVLDPIHNLAWEYEKIALYGNPQDPEWWGHRITA